MWSILIFDVDSPPLTRERREHQVFCTLLQMIPGMEDRLMESSEEDITHIAELVCNSGAPCVYFQTDHAHRFKRVLQVPDQTILRV